MKGNYRMTICSEVRSHTSWTQLN